MKVETFFEWTREELVVKRLRKQRNEESGKTAHSKVIQLKLLKQDREGSKLEKKRCIDLKIRKN